jgi:hypothetical protein
MVNEEVPKDSGFAVFFYNDSRPEGIADAIPALSHPSAKVFILSFCNMPFPKRDFTALLPHLFLPAGNAKITPPAFLIYMQKKSAAFSSYSSPPHFA